MNEYYKQVDGWCDYEDFYRDVATVLPINGTFVEIGVWAGRSLIFLLSCLQELNKDVNVFAVDTWEGSIDEPNHKKLIKEKFNGDIYKHFLDNLSKAGFTDKTIALKMTSVEAAKSFADKSIDVCFIDAGHTYDEVAQDIKTWYDKVCVGGVIAGHDLDHPPVRKAVGELLPNFKIARGHVWYYKKV